MGSSLSHVTVTGIDEGVDPRELQALRKAHPVIEWGILYHPERSGTPRYPGSSWINRFFKQCAEGPKSLHLCGSAVDRFMAGDGDVMELAARFNRVQLNFRAYSLAYQAADVDSAIRAFARPVITQHNSENEDMTSALTAPNHHVLFDASEGRGLTPSGWPQPIPGKKCGYAGNLSDRTLGQQWPRIAAAANGHRIWIDFESGARDRFDQFDIQRVDQTLRIISHLTRKEYASNAL